MFDVTVNKNQITFGDDFSLNFQRTLRIPDDGKTYPLPPGLGKFPVCRVEDYRDTVPASWLKHGGVFIPMYQRKAALHNWSMIYAMIPCSLILKSLKLLATNRNIRYVIP